MVKAKVNGVDMVCLRDSGTSFDLASAAHIAPEYYTQEKVFLQSPLCAAPRPYPVAKITLEFDGRQISTRAAVIPKELNLGMYLIGNRSAKLWNEVPKGLGKINENITRSHTRREEPQAPTEVTPVSVTESRAEAGSRECVSYPVNKKNMNKLSPSRIGSGTVQATVSKNNDVVRLPGRKESTQIDKVNTTRFYRQKYPKCKFAQGNVQYLRHVVGSGYRSPAQAKVQAVTEFPRPTTKTQVRAFLRLAGYYAHYIKNFSVLAAPLTSSLKGRNRKGEIEWTGDCENAFNSLKACLVRAPVLCAPDYSKEFILQVDSSDLGMGVVLSQLDDSGNEHPILYLSKKFSPTEQKFSTSEKECAGIIFAVKKLHHYLDGQKFKIITDHNPLVWLQNNSGANARLLRWSLALQPFNFTVEHKSGKLHKNADSLSRAGFD